MGRVSPSALVVRRSDLNDKTRTGSRWWYVLLAVPVVALLATPLYSRETPELFGFPFFYWYQFAWVPLSVLITYLVYTRTRTVGRAADEPPSSSGFTE
jgi:uncharacterized membrane protein YhdT